MLLIQLLLHASDWLSVLHIVDTNHVINSLTVSNILIPPLGGCHLDRSPCQLSEGSQRAGLHSTDGLQATGPSHIL